MCSAEPVDLGNKQVAALDAEIVGVIDGPRAWRVESNRHNRVPRCPRRSLSHPFLRYRYICDNGVYHIHRPGVACP